MTDRDLIFLQHTSIAVPTHHSIDLKMVLQGLSHKKSEARQIRFEIEGCEVIDYQKVGLRQKGGGQNTMSLFQLLGGAVFSL